MVSKAEADIIDQGIKASERLLSAFPTNVSKRIIELKAYPSEVISRIKQINGVIVEFQQRM